MLDPRVQQKGGFGAFAARAQARHDERAAAEAQSDREALPGPLPAVASLPTSERRVGCADGCMPV
jgi:hypothetical protein